MYILNITYKCIYIWIDSRIDNILIYNVYITYMLLYFISLEKPDITLCICERNSGSNYKSQKAE